MVPAARFCILFSASDILFSLLAFLYLRDIPEHLYAVAEYVYLALAVIYNLDRHLGDFHPEFLRPDQCLEIKREAIDLAALEYPLSGVGAVAFESAL